jgi:uroporphyrinogen decarboxylase
MPIRERFFKVMRRQSEGFVPFMFDLCPSLHEEFKRRTGVTDYATHYEFPVRDVFVKYAGAPGRFDKYYPDKTDIAISPAWGMGQKKGTLAHFTEMQHPMKSFQGIDEFKAWPYPDGTKDFDWADLKTRVEALKSKDIITSAHMEWTIFEVAWYLRGMELLLTDLLLNPDLAEYHLDRITTVRCEMARQAALVGCDVLRLGDDVGSQKAMMMKPATWRRFFKPRLAQVIRAAKAVKPDMMVFYHSDGNVEAVIPELIEVGVEILNPIQPECMDPVGLKRIYGDRLSFWGAIGTQTTMPFGTAEEVREVCTRMMAKMGKGGGYLLCPTHVLEPEVPWENIEAFLDVVKTHNRRHV